MQPKRPVEVRFQSLERRLETLEQVGKKGLPASRLTAIELRLEHLDESVRDLKKDVNRNSGRVEGRFNSANTCYAKLEVCIYLCSSIIILTMVLSQLFIP